MHFQFRWLGLCVCFTTFVRADVDDPRQLEAEWRERALQFINRIEDEKKLGRALFELNSARLRAGDIAGASSDARRISNPQLRSYAHYEIARFRKGLGDHTGAVREVNAARNSALERGFAYEHVNACLDIAESLEMAKNYVAGVEDRSRYYAEWSFAAALAQRGFVSEAMRIANRQADKRRPYVFKRIAQETAKQADIPTTEDILQRITAEEDRDAVYLDLIRALTRREQMDVATKFVDLINNPATRHSAERMTGRLGGKPIDDVTTEDLKKQIAAEQSPKVRQDLHRSLLGQQLKAKDIEGAEATMKAMIDLIRSGVFREEKSKFGNTTNESRIAFVEAKYLEISGIYAQRGETEKSRAALQRAKKAMEDMPDSSGMGKMFVVPGVLVSQIGVGEYDSVAESIRSLNPAFWQMQGPFFVKSFLNHGDTDTAIFIAETLLKGAGAGGSEILSTFVRSDEMDIVRELLERVNVDSHFGHQACHDLGSTMLDLGKTDLLLKWIAELPAATSAHLCIGAARMAGSYLLNPETDVERALVSYLTIREELPFGYRLVERRHSNPGMYRSTELPQVAKSLKHHRSGRAVRVLLAARATYAGEDQRDIEVTGYKLKDATAAAKLVSEMFIRPFRNRYLQKGPYVIFVNCEHWPERIEAGDAIQEILKQRKL